MAGTVKDLEPGAGNGLGRAVGVHFRLQDRFAATCRKLGTRKAAGAMVALRILDRELKSATGDERIRLERTLLALLPPTSAQRTKNTAPGVVAGVPIDRR